MPVCVEMYHLSLIVCVFAFCICRTVYMSSYVHVLMSTVSVLETNFVRVGRAENKAKQFSSSLTFAFHTKFSQNALFFERDYRIVSCFAQPTQAQSASMYVFLCRLHVFLYTCRISKLRAQMRVRGLLVQDMYILVAYSHVFIVSACMSVCACDIMYSSVTGPLVKT